MQGARSGYLYLGRNRTLLGKHKTGYLHDLKRHAHWVNLIAGELMKKSILVVLTIGLGFSACGPSQDVTNAPLKKLFNERHLQMLPNPGNDYMPGTILRKVGENDWIIGCEQHKARPGLRSKIRRTRTSDFFINVQDQRSVVGNALLWQFADIAAAFADKSTIKLKLKNGEMLRIDEADLQGEPPEQTCTRHLGIKAAENPELLELTVIMEALEADIVVDVAFDRAGSLSAKAKTDAISELKSRLEGALSANSPSKGLNPIGLELKNSSTGDAQLIGKRMIWAIKEDHRAAMYFLRGHGFSTAR